MKNLTIIFINFLAPTGKAHKSNSKLLASKPHSKQCDVSRRHVVPLLVFFCQFRFQNWYSHIFVAGLFQVITPLTYFVLPFEKENTK